jgi:hypothetical protein
MYIQTLFYSFAGVTAALAVVYLGLSWVYNALAERQPAEQKEAKTPPSFARQEAMVDAKASAVELPPIEAPVLPSEEELKSQIKELQKQLRRQRYKAKKEALQKEAADPAASLALEEEAKHPLAAESFQPSEVFKETSCFDHLPSASLVDGAGC